MSEIFRTILPAENSDGLPPVLVVDTREQAPLTFTRLRAITGTLTTGDYSFAGAENLFAVERKSIADLVACCVGENRIRFFRELHRLRGFRFGRLLVVGDPGEIEMAQYRSKIPPQSVFATLAAIEARLCPVVFCSTPEEAALRIESWACWSAREIINAGDRVRKGAQQTAFAPETTTATA